MNLETVGGPCFIVGALPDLDNWRLPPWMILRGAALSGTP
jgi:hypothetical protein